MSENTLPTVEEFGKGKGNLDALEQVLNAGDSTTVTTPSGKEHKSVAKHLKEMDEKADQTIEEKTIEFQSAIGAAGYESLGDWTAEVTTFTNYGQYALYNGIPYKPRSTASLPYQAQGNDPTSSPDADNVSAWTEQQGFVFSSISTMKSGLSNQGTVVTASMISRNDVKAETLGYHGGWAALAKPEGNAPYILTTLAAVRSAKGDDTWEPDGSVDHYLEDIGDGSTYVAMFNPSKGVINIKQAGAYVNGVSIDTKAISAAVSYAIDNFGVVNGVDLDSGEMLVDANIASITKPITVFGQGRRQSIIKVTSDADEVIVFELKNTGFGSESTEFPAEANTAYTDYSDVNSGVTMRGFSITGDRSVTQHGIRFKGNCDNCTLDDLDISYLNGRALWLGNNYIDPDTGEEVRGQVRESYFNNITIRNCGRTDSTASVSILKNESPDNLSADATNLCVFNDLHIIFPLGRGLEIRGSKYADSTPIYGLQFYGLIIHGRSGVTKSQGALIYLEGDLNNIKIVGDLPYQENDNYAGLVIAKDSVNGGIPTGLDIDLSMPTTTYGVDLQSHKNLKLKLRQAAPKQRLLRYGGDNGGILNLYVEGTAHLLKIDSTIVFDGTGSDVDLGDLSSVTGESTFFLEDTVLCEIDGVSGTVVKDSDAGTYTFTPDGTESRTVYAEKAYLNKVVIPRDKYDFITTNSFGHGTQQRKPSIAPWLEGSVLPRGTKMYFLNDKDTSGDYGYVKTQDDGNTLFGVTDDSGTEVNLFGMYAGASKPVMTMVRSLVAGQTYDSEALLRLGVYRFWIDSYGMLRKKSSTVTGDTEGTQLGEFVSAPASVNAYGRPGQWSADSDYLYWCYADNSWSRIAGESSGW